MRTDRSAAAREHAPPLTPPAVPSPAVPPPAVPPAPVPLAVVPPPAFPAAPRLTELRLTELRPLLAPLAAVLADRHRLDAEDLEQSVWLRVCEHAAAGALPGHPGPWLRGLALRECRRLTRTAEADHRAPACSAGRAPAPSAEEEVFADRARHALWAAVAALPGRCPRLLAVLADAPELTYRDLAALLGMPRGSIGPTRSRCLACLRTVLHGLRT
ncbi:RNA polymerase sigma factor [Kitasatospora sp. NPDC057015]|uniref:RNA polymerase sigma factor n=1 Tax=Kitasatospora sp. NPDC057015 TaxID=3346001 RepID=UPI00363627C3